MSSPLISVIIPVYNVEAYITQCLDSVLRQTHTNLEIICVDDCGQDNSIEMINTIAKNDERIVVVRNTANAGIAVARNTGMKAANGEYISFLDSDDYFDINALKNMVDNAINTNADIVAANTMVFADNPDDLAQQKTVEQKSKFLRHDTFGNYQVSLENFHEAHKIISVTSWGKLYKTSFIRENNLWFVDGFCQNEDVGFRIKWLACFPLISIINAVGVFYRQRIGSVMHAVDTQRAYKQQHIHQIQVSVLDGIAYIRAAKPKKIADILIDTVKRQGDYQHYIARQKPFYLRWTKHEKYIKLFGIKIFSKRARKNR